MCLHTQLSLSSSSSGVLRLAPLLVTLWMLSQRGSWAPSLVTPSPWSAPSTRELGGRARIMEL